MMLNTPPTWHWNEISGSQYEHPKKSQFSEERGHCYRCVFPKPPPAESVTTCGEGGILGPVVGVMGILMATEALKFLLPPPDAGVSSPMPAAKPTMLLYSAFSDTPFRTVRLGGRRKDCSSCSSNPSITRESLTSGSLDYAAFCGVRLPTDIVPSNNRISPTEYSKIRSHSIDNSHILIDVREKPQFDLAHLKGSINIPFSDLCTDPIKGLGKALDEIDAQDPTAPNAVGLYFICRFGNDSQVAVRDLRESWSDSIGPRYSIVGDVKGGLDAWRREVDGGFPDY